MRRTLTPERVLATVLFTDIVGSTELAATLGDRRWQDLVARHHRVVRAELKRFRGREIDTAGDGFFAIFDRPAHAIACATAIVDALRPLGLEVRVGLHAGEVERVGTKVGGIVVHTGARVVAAASPGEILVTATVRDLVAGSDVEFTDRGLVTLKGIPGEWRLFAVSRPTGPADVAAPAGPPRQEQPAAGRPRSRLSRTQALVGLVGVAVAVLAVAGAAALVPGLSTRPIVPGNDTVARIPAGARAFDLVIRVGSRPSALAVGEGAVWAVNFRDQTLSRIDPVSGEVLANPAVGGAPTGLAAGSGAVWVTTAFGTTAGEAGSVIKFNPRLSQVEDRIPVGSGAAAIAVGDGVLWIVDRLGDTLLKVDPSTKAVEEIAVGRAPGAVALGQGSIWVTSTLDRSLWRVDPATHEVVARIPLSSTPSSVAVGDAAVWVTSEAGDTVTRIDPATNTRVATVEVGDGPRGVALTGGDVWVAVTLAARVARIDPASNTVVATFPVDGSPDAIAVDERGAVWVSVHTP